MSVLAGCGLESNGLAEFGDEGDGGSSSGSDLDATSLQSDGTINVGSDGSGSNEDSTVPPGEDGSPSETSTSEDAGGDTGGSDASKEDGGTPDASADASIHDSGEPDGSDAAVSDAGTADAGADAEADAGTPCPTASGFVCTSQAVPPGWTLVEYQDSSSLGTCGGAYATSTSVYEGPFPPAKCTCDCTLGASGSCTTGNFSVKLDGLGGPCTSTVGGGPYAANSCNAIGLAGFSISGTSSESGSPVPYSAGQCSANGSTTLPPVGGPNGLECSGPSPSGATCPGGGACVPEAAGGFSLCIQKAGTPACPPGFPNVHTVGTSLGTDSRGCSTCTCGPPTAQCNDAMVTFWTDDTCADAGVGTVALNGSCNDIVMSNGTSNATARSFQYSATLTNEACGDGTSNPTGGVALDGTSTICCQ
jgi:hypothetical protein